MFSFTIFFLLIIDYDSIINIGLKDISRISDLAKNVDNSIETQLKKIKKIINDFNKNKNLTDDELDQILIDLFKMKNSIYLKKEVQDFNLNENVKAHDLSGIMEEYYRSKTEIAKAMRTEDKYKKISKSLTKLTIYLGGIIFIVELFLIYYLTFEVYAWDITEPMTYLLGCFNLILIFYMKKKFNGKGAFQYFDGLFLNMFLKRSKKIDFQKVERLRRNVTDIERFMTK